MRAWVLPPPAAACRTPAASHPQTTTHIGRAVHQTYLQLHDTLGERAERQLTAIGSEGGPLLHSLLEQPLCAVGHCWEGHASALPAAGGRQAAGGRCCNEEARHIATALGCKRCSRPLGVSGSTMRDAEGLKGA